MAEKDTIVCMQAAQVKRGTRLPVPERIRSVQRSKEQRESDLHGLQFTANQQPRRGCEKEQVTHVTWRFLFPCRRRNGTRILDGAAEGLAGE